MNMHMCSSCGQPALALHSASYNHLPLPTLRAAISFPTREREIYFLEKPVSVPGCFERRLTLHRMLENLLSCLVAVVLGDGSN